MFEELCDLGKSPTEIAKELGVHVGTVYRWIYSKVRGRQLKSILIGGRRRILKVDLEDFVGIDQPDDSEADKSRQRLAQNRLKSFGLRSAKDRSPKS